jgi:hypothetical protein
LNRDSASRFGGYAALTVLGLVGLLQFNLLDRVTVFLDPAHGCLVTDLVGSPLGQIKNRV